jgi:hypothetical protein
MCNPGRVLNRFFCFAVDRVLTGPAGRPIVGGDSPVCPEGGELTDNESSEVLAALGWDTTLERELAHLARRQDELAAAADRSRTKSLQRLLRAHLRRKYQ